MCRNIKTLYNFDPPATEAEIRASSVQFVRKLTGIRVPSKTNEAAFDQAVEDVVKTLEQLFDALETTAAPKDREIEAERRKALSAKRFA